MTHHFQARTPKNLWNLWSLDIKYDPAVEF